MGVLCDLVMADEGDAVTIGTAEHLVDDFRVFPTKMLDQVTLDGLFSLIDPDSPDIESWWQIPLYEEEERWVYQLPPCFIENLARLQEIERGDLARRWEQTGELGGFYVRESPAEVAADVRKLVDEVCAFALEATERGKQVFLHIVI